MQARPFQQMATILPRGPVSSSAAAAAFLGAVLWLAASRPPKAQEAPGAARVALALERAGDSRAAGLYLAGGDGSGLRRLGGTYGRLRAPTFSPDGRWVACQAGEDLGLESVLLEPVHAGPGLTSQRLAAGAQPQWSRDGKRLLYTRRQYNEHWLYVIRSDGAEREESLKPLLRAQLGRWSPDEKQLAVVAPVILQGVDRWQIQILPTDTLKPRLRLTLPENMGQVASLEWSPSGEQLLFTVTRQGTFELYLLTLKTLEPQRVPLGETVSGAFGVWSPDGKSILYRSSAGSEGTRAHRLCVMSADGTRSRVLWDASARGYAIQGIAWAPPPPALAQAPPPRAAPPVPVKPPPPVEPVKPAPRATPPSAPPAPPPSFAAWQKIVLRPRLRVDRADSPISVPLFRPGDQDFQVRVAAPANPVWKARRQGLGITVELTSGALYRGTLIHNQAPWVTLQGRSGTERVRLMDGKELPATQVGFQTGFVLSLFREGRNLQVVVNGEKMLQRPVFTGAVRQVSLTLENFDAGASLFAISEVSYRTAERPAPTGDRSP